MTPPHHPVLCLYAICKNEEFFPYILFVKMKKTNIFLYTLCKNEEKNISYMLFVKMKKTNFSDMIFVKLRKKKVFFLYVLCKKEYIFFSLDSLKIEEKNFTLYAFCNYIPYTEKIPDTC